MRIEYENKFSDILLFNAVHQFLSPAMQGLFVVLFGFIFWSELNSNSVTGAAITALFWYLGLWVFQFVFNVICLYSRKNGSIFTAHVVEVLDSAFLEETKFNKSYFYWPGVLKAVSRPGFIAVYVSPHQAHVVPNRAFSSSAQRASFLALVMEKISANAKV